MCLCVHLLVTLLSLSVFLFVCLYVCLPVSVSLSLCLSLPLSLPLCRSIRLYDPFIMYTYLLINPIYLYLFLSLNLFLGLSPFLGNINIFILSLRSLVQLKIPLAPSSHLLTCHTPSPTHTYILQYAYYTTHSLTNEASSPLLYAPVS